ncbi:hypothetical protein WN943_002853 [Citrus x changshan-huyou]
MDIEMAVSTTYSNLKANMENLQSNNDEEVTEPIEPVVPQVCTGVEMCYGSKEEPPKQVELYGEGHHTNTEHMKVMEISSRNSECQTAVLILWGRVRTLITNQNLELYERISVNSIAMASTKVQRIMTQPIKARIQIWLFEQKDLRIEGRIIGFDEYMNLVLDDAEEVHIKKNTRKPLGGSDDGHSGNLVVCHWLSHLECIAIFDAVGARAVSAGPAALPCPLSINLSTPREAKCPLR